MTNHTLLHGTADEHGVSTVEEGGVGPFVDDEDSVKTPTKSPSHSASSNEQPIIDDDNHDDHDDNKYHHHHGHNKHTTRNSYFSFVPEIGLWGFNIVSHETNLVKDAVVGFPSWSQEYAQDTWQYYKANPRTLYNEIISGFTVAIMQVPESIAFSFVAGVPPLSGLQATFWMATITGLFGGKPGMISGAAGALAVVVDELTLDDGVLSYLPNVEDRLNVLYMTMFVCGIFQIAFCVFRMAALVRLIPETGMIGFMNGLAIIIFMAQLPAFMKCSTPEEYFVQCKVSNREWLTFSQDTLQLILTLIHVFICMIIMQFFRRVPKIGKVIPASLVALLLGTLIEHTLYRKAIDQGTRTVGETAPLSGDVPRFSWPQVPNDSKTMQIIFTFAVMLAAIGSVESVLTLQACNEITDTVPEIGDSNQELFAQGLANAVCGMFRAMGGDAMIGQSTINIMNGARHRVSSTSSGLFMLLFIVAISGFIELIPIATLTGVLFMVVISTFQWQTFEILRYGRLSDSCVILIVTITAVFSNLAIAIAAGVVFSALMYAWDSGKMVSSDISVKKMLVNGEECDVKYVHVKGSIFFSSSRALINMFDVANDPDVIIMDLADALVFDHSAVAAIQGITHRFKQVGKRVLLTNVPSRCHGRLHRTGDHAMLKDQLHDDSAFVDVPHGDQEQEMESEQHPEHHAPGEIHVGELQKLRMFQAGGSDIDSELESLDENQGQVSIHELKKKE